jgi:hypothetical protein
MRLFAGLAAVALVVAGCSSEAGTPARPKAGCGLFDQHAVASALVTTDTITEQPSKTGTDCVIGIGAGHEINVLVVAHPDNPETGYASWLKIAHDTGAVRERTPANGDKVFVASDPHPQAAVGGVLHDGTFYSIKVLAETADPPKTANALVDVLEAAL